MGSWISALMGSWWTGFRAGRSGSSSNLAPPNGIKMLNDLVFLLSGPEDGVAPDRKIVFIHGLQVSDYEQAYWKTWTVGKNDKECWPMTWLKATFLRARILSLCYDSSASETSTTGRLNLFLAGETLVQDMVARPASIGQHSCPVVFVCHSLGGLVVKEIVMKAHYKFGRDIEYKNLLQNIRRIHFYATPHLGSKLADYVLAIPTIPAYKKSKMVKALTVINNEVGRLNDNFNQSLQELQEQYNSKWEFAVVAEKNATSYYGFSAVVVEEASARHIGHKKFKLVDADHFGVCKPESTSSNSYLSLMNFITDVVGEGLEELM